jgi:alpha/beta superfamily hydrolase
MQDHAVTERSARLTSFTFPGPAGVLEGLWKDGRSPVRGSAVFAHPHPLHGGTLHNKVVFCAAQALISSGFGTLRFNFRGTGVSDGIHDQGVGEVEDFRAAMNEAEARGGLPMVAGGFSFGSSMALRAIAGDTGVAAYIGIGLPVATPSVMDAPLPRVPSLFVVGERDTFGPPRLLREFLGESYRIVEVEGADHFFEGKLDTLEKAITSFLASLALPVPTP